MPHRGWRIGRGSVETESMDRLTADRLAGLLSFLSSISPGSSTDSEVLDAPGQASETERSAVAEAPGRRLERPQPEAASPSVDSPPTAPLAPVVEPTAAQPIVRPEVLREVEAETDGEPSEIAPAGPVVADLVAAGSRAGRHRPPQSSRLSIRGISLSGRRLALVAAVTVLVVVSAVLALT